MPKPNDEDTQTVTDPVVLAALIEDPDEDDDDKKMRDEMLGGETAPGGGDEDEDEDDPKKKNKKPPEAADDQDDPEDEDDSDKPKKTEKKPPEAADDGDDPDGTGDEDLDTDKPKTSKQKREDRKAFFDSIRKEGAAPKQSRQLPSYSPVDYAAAPEDGFKPDELKADRDQYGNLQFIRGAETVEYWAQQDKFLSDLASESKLVGYDPDLQFLVEEKPDGTKNPDFDEDKTAEINENYLLLVGYKEFYKTNDQGQQLYDPQTRQPLVVQTVDRTDISYEKFAKRYVANMKSWANDFADDEVETVTKGITSQRKKQGMRPGSASRKTLGAIQPGDISAMSDEDFEKNEAEIDRQIAAML